LTDIIRILDQSDDTVTISRDEWTRLREELAELQDSTAVAERRAYERLVGGDIARQDYLTAAEALRLLDGESPLKVWREKRGLSQRALAAAVGAASSYLAEIETDRKPGSDAIYRKLATALRVPLEELDRRQYRSRDPQHGPVVLRLRTTSSGHRGALGEPMQFPTVQDALDFVGTQWGALRKRAPQITDPDFRPIYDTGELIRQIDG
jgi:DNA-binding XRE family transcriptional regulator